MTAFLSSRPRSDVHYLYAARALRGFGDGFAIIILPAYLLAVGFTPQQVGMVASASLLGTAALTLLVGFVAPRHDLRNLLLAGAGLAIVTGLVFPMAETIAPVLLVAFIGTINPSAGDLGMLIPLEHALLTQETDDRDRTSVFARYSLIGSLTAAAGSLAAAVPEFLTSRGLAEVNALRLMFYGYALLGLFAAVLYSRLPQDHMRAATRPKSALGPSRRIVYKLAALFSLDAFAGGFVVQSLLVLWLFQRFDLSLGAASAFFFCASLLSAISFPVAAWLAKRIGLVNTMVFTHIPSSLCLIAVAFSSNLTVVLVLLLIRAALSQMDVPTRSSYVMAVVTPDERSAAASVTAVPRSLASAISPAIAGFMLAGPFSALPLVVCGCLKIAYDLALLGMFRHSKPPEES
ncbi:MFS transporter [Bradyrhizobium erythrophlei]|uniref:Fucose permease n=1 Tax=Bradyrhizobium erythrophlei TaxID=1437360 RepID=A0A1M5IEL0_9BRAD|nr:MFS transporter [Bradyrhizobium erythrophlei]SHG26243.1 Fucose permease [Bradyrhizobium erythrophlei]